jgi:AcrR family transcriptional regulator
MDTPERILAAALRLYAARGYEAVGVQELTEAAGVTKPSLYHHFGSKEGVLAALVAGYAEPWLDRLASAATYRGDLPLTVFEVAREFLGYAAGNPDYHRLHLAMWYSAADSVPHRVIAPPLLRQHQILERLFQDAARDHGNLCGHHAAYAISFAGILNGYISSLLEVGLPLDDAVAREASRQFMHGIYAL